MVSFHMVQLQGTPYEIGFGHGSKCRDQVLASIRYYQKAFAANGVSWEDGKRLGLTYESHIAVYAPQLLEEMRGIADGAQVSYEDILAMNCRSEMTRMKVGEKLAGLTAGGCTAFAVMADKTVDCKTYHAQTWDFGTMQRDAMVVLNILPQGTSPALFLITEGGLVGGKGMNACGMSLTLNALRTSGVPEGVPLHVVMRKMLESHTIAEAFHWATCAPCAAAGCITIAIDNAALAIELVPGDMDVLTPSGGILVHTNHVLSTRFRNIEDLGRRNLAGGSSFLRYSRCHALLSRQTPFTLADIQAVMCDHVGYPKSICMHADESLPLAEQTSSNYAVVFDLTDRVIHLCAGNPCQGAYTQFRVQTEETTHL